MKPKPSQGLNHLTHDPGHATGIPTAALRNCGRGGQAPRRCLSGARSGRWRTRAEEAADGPRRTFPTGDPVRSRTRPPSPRSGQADLHARPPRRGRIRRPAIFGAMKPNPLASWKNCNALGHRRASSVVSRFSSLDELPSTPLSDVGRLKRLACPARRRKQACPKLCCLHT